MTLKENTSNRQNLCGLANLKNPFCKAAHRYLDTFSQ